MEKTLQTIGLTVMACAAIVLAVLGILDALDDKYTEKYNAGFTACQQAVVDTVSVYGAAQFDVLTSDGQNGILTLVPYVAPVEESLTPEENVTE